MGLLDNLKKRRQNKHIDTLSIEEINNEIELRKKEIAALKKDLVSIQNDENKKSKSFAAKKNQLKREQKEVLSSFIEQKKQLNSELEKVTLQSDKNKALFDKLDKEVNKKLMDLVSKRDELISTATNKNDSKFKAAKKELIEQIEALEAEQTNQKLAYKAKLEQSEKEFIAIYKSKEANLKDVTEKLEQAKLEKDKKVKDVTKRFEQEEVKANTKRKAMSEANDVAKRAIDKEFVDLDEKKAILKDLYFELDNLKVQYKAIQDDLNVSNNIREKEFNNYVDELNNEKREAQRYNEKLKQQIEEIQKELVTEKQEHISDHDSKMAELASLEKNIESSKVDAISEMDRVYKDVFGKRNEDISNFSYYLEDKYNKQVEANKKALDELQRELEAHKQGLITNADRLNQLFIANKQEYDKNISNVKDEIASIEKQIYSVKEDEEKEIFSLKDKLADLRLRLKGETQQHANKLANELDEYRKYNVSQRVAIETEIESIHSQIKSLKLDLAEAKKQSKTIDAETEYRIANIKNEHKIAINQLEQEKKKYEEALVRLAENLEENRKKHTSTIARLDAKLDKIKKLNDEEIDKLTTTNNKKVEAIRSEFEKEYQELIAEYTKKKENINKQNKKDVANVIKKHNAEVLELTENNGVLSERLTQLVTDSEKRINVLDSKKVTAQEQLNNLKNMIAKYSETISEKRKVLEQTYLDEVNKIDSDYKKEVAAIEKENQEIPQDELNKIRALYAEKVSEVKEATKSLEEHRKQAAEDDRALLRKKEEELYRVQKELESIDNKYQLEQKNKEDEINRLNAELDSYKTEIEHYESTLVEKARALEENKNKELENLKNKNLEILNIKRADLEKNINDYKERLAGELAVKENENRLELSDLANRNQQLHNSLLEKENSYNEQIAKIKQEITELNDAKTLLGTYKTRTKKMDDELIKLKEEYDVQLSTRETEYQNALILMKNEYESSRQQMVSKTEETKKLIVGIEREIKKIAKEEKAIIAESQEDKYDNSVKIAELNRQQKELENKRNELSENIVNIRQKHKDEMDKLDQVRADADLSYEKDINTINSRFDARRIKLEKSFKKEMEELNANDEKIRIALNISQENKLKDLDVKLVQDKENLEKEIIEISKNIEDVKKKKENTIKTLEAKRARVTEEYDKAKAAFDIDYARYENERRELEENYQTKLSELNTAHLQNIAEIEDEYQRVPTEDLAVVQAEYEEKVEELRVATDEFTTKKNELDKVEEDKRLTAQQLLNEANDSLAKTRDVYNTHKNEYDSECQTLQNELENYRKEVEAHKIQLEEKIEDLKKGYEEQLYTLQTSNNVEFENARAIAKNKLDEYKQLKQEEFNQMKAKYDVEFDAIRQKSNEINGEYKKLDDELNKRIEEYTNANNEITRSLNELKFNSNSKIQSIKNSNEEYRESVKSNLDNKKMELQETIKSYLNKYAQIKADILSETARVQKSITEAVKEIKDFKDKTIKCEADTMKRIADVETTNTYNIEKINTNRRNIEVSTNELGKKLEEAKARYESDVRALDERKENYIKTAEEKMERLKLANEKNISDVTDNHREDIAKIHMDVENTMSDINQKNVDAIVSIEKELEDAKTRYESEKTELEVLTDKLQKDYDNNIGILQNNRNETLGKINEIKHRFEEEMAKMESSRNAFDLDQNKLLAELEHNQAIEIENIRKEYEDVPNQQLEEVNKIYQEKLIDVRNAKNEFENRKLDADKQVEEANIKFNSIKDSANVKLQEAKEAYDEKAKIVGLELNKLKENFNEKQRDYDVLKEQLDNEIEAINEKYQIDLNALTTSFNEEKERLEKLGESKREELQRNLDNELSIKRQEGEARINQINEMIKEIEERKQAQEDAYNLKFAEESKRTRDVEAEYNRVLAENDNYRKTFAENFERKKKDYANDIENTKRKHQEILQEKRAAYEDYIKQTQDKCETIKKEIAKLESEKSDTESAISAYVKEKRDEIDICRQEIDIYVKDINTQITKLNSQEVSLMNEFETTQQMLKEQISDIMSDYDELITYKPNKVNIKTKQTSDSLLEQASEFKKKILELAEVQKQTLRNITDTRNKVIDKTIASIEDRINGKNNKIKSINDEIVKISESYNRLIQAEKDKQDHLRAEMNKIMEIKRIEKEDDEDMYTRTQQDYEGQKNELARVFDANRNGDEDYYGEHIANLRKIQKELQLEKDKVVQETNELRGKYDDIDREIALKKQRLVEDYYSDITDIKNKHVEVIAAERNRWKEKDVISDSVEKLFRNKKDGIH